MVAAVSQGRPEVTRLLLQSGRVKDVEVPFHIAARNRGLPILEELLRAGPRVCVVPCSSMCLGFFKEMSENASLCFAFYLC